MASTIATTATTAPNGSAPNGHGKKANGEASSKNVEKSTKGDTLQLENLLLRDEELFQSSLDSDDYLENLAPVIKDAVRRNGLSALITKLNDIVRAKDEELNEVSMNSMDEINQCMNTIASIHTEADSLKRQFLSVTQNLSKSSIELMTKKKNYVKYKEVCSRISEAQVVLTECIQVLELMNRILELIKQTKYFSALKLTDELTNIHIQKVNEFSFAKKIVDSIPHLTQMIKDDSFENLIKWLSLNLERKLPTIGDALYDNLYDLQDKWAECKAQNPTYAPYKLNSPVESSLRDPSSYYNVFEDETLKIPLSSVYDAILVYRTLHESENLSAAYHKEWMKKYSRIIYPLTSVATNTKEQGFKLDQLEPYLKKMAAFFVMDKQLNLVTKFQLRANVQSEELWLSYVSKLKPRLLQTIEESDFYDVRELSQFKNILGDFMQIMDSNGYDVTEIYEVMMVIFRNNFAPLIVQSFKKKFVESLQSEHNQAFKSDQEEYEGVMKHIFYDQNAPFVRANVKSFPVNFPFSEDFVKFCIFVRSMIKSVLDFIREFYNYEVNEINNIILNDIVEAFLSDRKGVGIAWEIEDFITRNADNKEIIAQSFVNLEYYTLSLYKIGVFLNERLRRETGMGIHNIDTNDAFTLVAVGTFVRLKKFSEDTVYKMIDSKITQLLSIVEYNDYLPVERNTEANFAVKDFALFLENLFTSIFENFPSSLRTLGLFRSYDFVSQHFLAVLKNADQYNEVFIDNFDLDIQHLEKSIKKLNSTATAEDQDSTQGAVSIESTFTELRQTVDLLKSNNYDEYATNSSFRTRHYNSVKFEDGMKYIKKMHGAGSLATSPQIAHQSQFQRSGTIKSISQSISGSNFAHILQGKQHEDANTNTNTNTLPSKQYEEANNSNESLQSTPTSSKFASIADRFKLANTSR